jgi:SH3 domain-containing YSC84-like protein 1
LKRLLAAVGVFAFALPAAADEKETRRLAACQEVLTEALGMPESFPRDLLDRAECVIVIPSLKKAAFVVGARWGKGAAVCRRRGEHAGWGPPLMMSVGGGSVGWQIGGQAADYVLLVMNPRGMDSLLKSKFTLGADASLAGGPKGRSAAASTDIKMRAEILTYSRSRGVFAGVSLEGTVIHRDDDANESIYGEAVSPRRVLFQAGYDVPPAARGLVAMLNEHSP